MFSKKKHAKKYQNVLLTVDRFDNLAPSYIYSDISDEMIGFGYVEKYSTKILNQHGCV